MKKVCITVPLEADKQEKFTHLCEKFAYAVDFRDTKEMTPADYAGYEVIIGTPAPSDLSRASSLRYLHLSMAGSNAFVKEGVLAPGVLLTNSSGNFGHAIIEHMMGMVYSLYKKLHLYRDNQNESLWRDEGAVRSIHGAKVLVVGMGDIGEAFAKTAHALGMHVSGIRRTTVEKPVFIEVMYSPDELKSIVGNFDIVALSLPETAKTVHLFDEKMIDAMKDGAVLLNVGRGSAIDTDALVRALQSGKLYGAGLDVTEPEPLPADHPLWKCTNCLITPHISGFFHLRDTYDAIVSLAYDNLSAYFEGKTPKNVVDFATGYRKA